MCYCTVEDSSFIFFVCGFRSRSDFARVDSIVTYKKAGKCVGKISDTYAIIPYAALYSPWKWKRNMARLVSAAHGESCKVVATYRAGKICNFMGETRLASPVTLR